MQTLVRNGMAATLSSTRTTTHQTKRSSSQEEKSVVLPPLLQEDCKYHERIKKQLYDEAPFPSSNQRRKVSEQEPVRDASRLRVVYVTRSGKKEAKRGKVSLVLDGNNIYGNAVRIVYDVVTIAFHYS